jgi:nucleoside-diphosphate-sugar epimerase
MKTLFLGSSGFVGNALIENLKSDFDITLLTRNETEIQEFHGSIIRGDLIDLGTLELLSKRKFERVIDCSWTGLPNLSTSNNLENYRLKKKFIEIMVNADLREYVGIGSCLEYGDLQGIAHENDMGSNIGDFGRVKLEVLNLVVNSGMKFKWFRPFYLIGSRQHKNSLLNTAIRTLEKGYDFIPRESSKSFDFIDISEATAAMKLVIENQNCNGIYNVGSGETKSVNYIVNAVRRAFGLQEKEDQVFEGLSADIRKLQVETGWKISESLEESLQKIISKLRVH